MRMYKFLEWRIPQHSLRSFVILAGKSASGGSNSPGTGCRRPVCHLLSVIHWEGNWQQTRFRDVLNQTNVCWAALLTKFFLTHSAFYLISIHNTFTAHLNLSRTGASITQSGFYFQNLPNKKKTKKKLSLSACPICPHDGADLPLLRLFQSVNWYGLQFPFFCPVRLIPEDHLLTTARNWSVQLAGRLVTRTMAQIPLWNHLQTLGSNS